MTIQPATSFGDISALLAPLAIAHGMALPDKALATIFDNQRSPLDRAIDLAEGLYAVAQTSTGALQADAAGVAGAIALFVAANRFQMLPGPDRALKMANACRRLAGESVDQHEAEDPAPLPEYVPA